MKKDNACQWNTGIVRILSAGCDIVRIPAAVLAVAVEKRQIIFSRGGDGESDLKNFFLKLLLTWSGSMICDCLGKVLNTIVDI